MRCWWRSAWVLIFGMPKGAAYQKGPKFGRPLACADCQQIAFRLAQIGTLLPQIREEKVAALRQRITADLQQERRGGKTLRGPGRLGQVRDRVLAVARILEPSVQHRPASVRGTELLLQAHDLAALFDHLRDVARRRAPNATLITSIDAHLHHGPAWLQEAGEVFRDRLWSAIDDDGERWRRRRDAAVLIAVAAWHGVSPLTVRRGLAREAAVTAKERALVNALRKAPAYGSLGDLDAARAARPRATPR
jgi:hypothetical protein